MTPLQHKASLRYWTAWLITTAARLFGQTEYRGAYSSIFAATDPSLTGGWCLCPFYGHFPSHGLDQACGQGSRHGPLAYG